jgi:hypothetical protein
LEDLDDHWEYPKRNYELWRKFSNMGRKPIGITEKYDSESNDEWAPLVGWYVVNLNGIAMSYTHLEDVMVAHDMCVIRKHGKVSKPAGAPSIAFRQRAEWVE